MLGFSLSATVAATVAGVVSVMVAKMVSWSMPCLYRSSMLNASYSCCCSRTEGLVQDVAEEGQGVEQIGLGIVAGVWW